MILAIAKNEFLQYFRSHKLTIAMLVCCTLMPLSVFTMLLDYDQRYTNFIENQSKRDLYRGPGYHIRWKENNELHQFYGGFFYPYSGHVKKPSRLSIFAKGTEDALSGTFQLFGHWLEPVYGIKQERNIYASLFGSFDLLLVTKLAVGLLAVILGCSSIVSERQMGTLALILTNKIGRAQFIIGKFIGGVSVVLASYIAGFILCLILLIAWPSWSFTTTDFVPVALIFLTFIIYVIFSYLLGMTISCLCRETTTASITAVGIWLLIIVLLPLLLLYCVKIIHKVPTAESTRRERITVAKDMIEEVKTHFNSGGTTKHGLRFLLGDMGENIDYKISKAIGDIEEKRFRAEQTQMKLTTSLLTLTPSGALTNMVSDLACTSSRSYLAYKSAALKMRDILLSRLFPTVDELLAISRGNLDPGRFLWDKEPTLDYIKSLHLEEKAKYFLEKPLFNNSSKPWRTKRPWNSDEYNFYTEAHEYIGGIDQIKVFRFVDLVSLIITTFIFFGTVFCLIMKYDVRPR